MLKTVDYNLDKFNEKLTAQNDLSYSKLLNKN